MSVSTNGPIIHGVFCTLAGVVFLVFILCAVLGPATIAVGGQAHGWNSWVMPSLLLLGFGLLFQIVLGVWVGVDASRRGMNGFLWGALVAFTCVIGLIVYLLAIQQPAPGRAAAIAGAAESPSAAAGVTCPECHRPMRPDFKLCPYCGAAAGRSCPQCRKPAEADWKVCPACGSSL